MFDQWNLIVIAEVENLIFGFGGWVSLICVLIIKVLFFIVIFLVSFIRHMELKFLVQSLGTSSGYYAFIIIIDW